MRDLRVWEVLCLSAVLCVSSAPYLAAELKRDVPSAQKITEKKDLEPSGIVSTDEKILYVVSDNAKIMKIILKIDKDGAVTVESDDYIFQGDKSDKNYDFESVAFVPDRPGFLYVGIEGHKKKKQDIKPAIREFNLTTNDFTDQKWELKDIDYNDKSGMEALTFVPDTTAKGGFKGYFLAASQKDKKGKINAYDLDPMKSGAVSKSFDFTIKQCKTSDLYYYPTAGVLYVAYDEKCSDKPGKAVWEYKREKTGKDATYGLIAQTPLGNSGEGLEAVTAVAKASQSVYLYLGFDTNKEGNRVDLYQPYQEYTLCGGKKSTCKDIQGSHCGWCQSATGDNHAFYGTSAGQTSAMCQNWIWKNSDCDACKGVTTCREIEGKDCVWCIDPVQQAMPEDKDGSPVYKAGCKKWIQKHQDCPKTN